jgi:glutamate racemase
MKIGIFDSGLGGLVILNSIYKALPAYDYVYLGDTKRVPYGNRSHEAVYEFTRECVDYLFRKENCAIIIIACNTASARALRRIQQDYLPKNFPDRKVLGVLIPLAEEAAKYERVGILATSGTVASNSFPQEIKKINKKTIIIQNSAPMLVPLIEEGEKVLVKDFIKKYLKPFVNKKLDAIALGCTHYPILRGEFSKLFPQNIKILSQDKIVPQKFKEYLNRHPEIQKKLFQKKIIKILVTDKTQTMNKLTQRWFGRQTKPKLVKMSKT